MPAYRAALSDADMADLLTYLRSDSCCFEDDPPRNPRYIAAQASPSDTTAAPSQQTRVLRGGAWGLVKSSDGTPLEGIGIDHDGRRLRQHRQQGWALTGRRTSRARSPDR